MTDRDPLAGAPSPGRWWHAGARRSLVLAALGAIVGLLIAGFGLFTAHGTRTAGVPPEDAAVVNGVPILMVDYLSQLRALYDKSLAETTAPERSRALDDMIREELYVQRGVELGMQNDDIDVRAAMVRSTESQVAADAMTTRPTEADLHGWYDQHRALYASEGVLDLSDWVVPTVQAAHVPAIVTALRAGTPPAKLGLADARTFPDGPQYYLIARLRLGDALYAAVHDLPDGAWSVPIARADGVHIVRVNHNQRPQPDRFDDARAKVAQDWIADKVKRLTEGNDRFLRRRADIKIAAPLK